MSPSPAPQHVMPRWAWLLPALGLAALGLGLVMPGSLAIALVCLAALIGAVIAAVHHAEVVAHRVGEPFGTLVLAIAITVIEVSLILAAMLGGGADKESLPRDTIFATIMIIVNGVVGVCLLVGGLLHREQSFRIDGTAAGVAALIALASLSLVLPTYTTSSPGPTYNPAQLIFAAVASLLMWAVYVFGQTVRHREYFAPAVDAPPEASDGPLPSAGASWTSLVLLVLALVVVVGLAKVLSPTLASGVAALGAPKAVLGIAIALLVLLPETWAAVRAAVANRLQTSLNLAIGSALASIGLTIPVVAVAAIVLDLRLDLGLDAKSQVLLLVTFLIAGMTLATGRTTVMQGAVHLVMFAAYLFLSLVP